MAQIKLNFSRLSIPEKLQRARHIALSMTGNTHFTNPHPTPVDIQNACSTLEDAALEVQVARQTAKLKTTTQSELADGLDKLMSQMASYVAGISGGDETIIQSAGMDLRATPGALAMPAQPQGLAPTEGDHDGEIDLSWDPVVDASSYVIETSPDPPTATSWKHAAVSTKSSSTITDLAPGSRLWFRVAAINPAGRSGWSDPATKIVP